MNPSEVQKITRNLQIQLSELEALQSMYTREELRVEDLTVLARIHAFVEGRVADLPPHLDLTVNLLVDRHKFELCVNLSHEYPAAEPDLYVRNHRLNKQQHAAINRDLGEHVAALDRGEECVFSAISWLQDHAGDYVVSEDAEELRPEKDEGLVRLWIYSHHIYSKSKRREIADLAERLNVTGFCMPGKPGIICVEGTTSDCNEWWQSVKAMNWKRIFCKISEQCGDEGEDFLKFRTFEERVFQSSNIKCNHMDMGELYKFLEDHRCGYIFKDIFGVEAKSGA